jgi:hypothetical protein
MSTPDETDAGLSKIGLTWETAAELSTIPLD